MENIELTLKEARSLAKYYSQLCQRHYLVVISDEDKRKDWECLSYCRGIILKKTRKKKSESTENEKILEVA